MTESAMKYEFEEPLKFNIQSVLAVLLNTNEVV